MTASMCNKLVMQQADQSQTKRNERAFVHPRRKHAHMTPYEHSDFAPFFLQGNGPSRDVTEKPGRPHTKLGGLGHLSAIRVLSHDHCCHRHHRRTARTLSTAPGQDIAPALPGTHAGQDPHAPQLGEE